MELISFRDSSRFFRLVLRERERERETCPTISQTSVATSHPYVVHPHYGHGVGYKKTRTTLSITDRLSLSDTNNWQQLTTNQNSSATARDGGGDGGGGGDVGPRDIANDFRYELSKHIFINSRSDDLIRGHGFDVV